MRYGGRHHATVSSGAIPIGWDVPDGSAEPRRTVSTYDALLLLALVVAAAAVVFQPMPLLTSPVSLTPSNTTASPFWWRVRTTVDRQPAFFFPWPEYPTPRAGLGGGCLPACLPAFVEIVGASANPLPPPPPGRGLGQQSAPEGQPFGPAVIRQPPAPNGQFVGHKAPTAGEGSCEFSFPNLRWTHR